MTTHNETVSRLTCPVCGHSSRETMPEDACQWFFECRSCGELLSPRRGDCRVFCSYGDAPCPPIQQARRGEGEGCCGG